MAYPPTYKHQDHYGCATPSNQGVPINLAHFLHSAGMMLVTIGLGLLLGLGLTEHVHADNQNRPTTDTDQEYSFLKADHSAPHACHYRLPAQKIVATPNDTSIPTKQQPIYALANSSEQTEHSTRLTGNVEVTKGRQVLTGDEIIFHRTTQALPSGVSEVGTGTASGNITLGNGDFVLLGSQATFNNNLNTAQVDNAQYIDLKSELRTQADTIQLHADETISVEQGQFTFCPPGNNSWHIDSSRINIYPDKGFAEAYNATLKIGSVPVFYLPWLSVPIDDKRRSGFLFPQVSLNSQDGLHLATPYYANLAPNYDVVITPHWRHKRGTSVTVAARHLTNIGYSRANTLLAPHDDITQSQRWYLNYQFEGDISSQLSLDVDLARASDIDLFDDYDYPVKHADDDKIASHWQFNYQYHSPWLQTMQFGSKFYQQLTDATPTYNQNAYAILAGKSTQQAGSQSANTTNRTVTKQTWQYQLVWRDFDRDNTSLSGLNSINGQRLHITPKWQRHWQTSYGYVKTSMGLPMTQYQLQDYPINTLASPQRDLYQLELDAGLWFDRPYAYASKTTHYGNQTLEPRLYWTYTPYKAQDHLPVFDTSEISKPLYQPNRFSGADRIGDTHRVTLALTSRVTNHQGAQKAKFSLAQIHYLQDRQVQLPDKTVQTDRQSPIYASIDYQVNQQINTQLNIDWQTNSSKSNAINAKVEYQSGQDQYFNLNYTQNTDAERQIKASVIWPIAANWTGFIHNTTNLVTDRALSQAIGVEYIDCCWALRVIGHDWLNDAEESNKQAIYVEMSLKGIDTGDTGLSNNISDRLQRFTKRLTN